MSIPIKRHYSRFGLDPASAIRHIPAINCGAASVFWTAGHRVKQTLAPLGLTTARLIADVRFHVANGRLYLRI